MSGFAGVYFLSFRRSLTPSTAQRAGQAQLAIALALSGAIVGLIYLMGIYLVRHWRQFRLHLGPDSLVQEAGATRQEVAWRTVTKLRIMTDKQGQPVRLAITSEGARPIILAGIEPMGDLIELIQSRLSAKVEIENNSLRFDRESPWIKFSVISFGVVIGFLIALSDYWFGDDSIRSVLLGFLFVSLGAFFLLFGPNPAFRKFEIIFGTILLIIGLTRMLSTVW